MTTALVADDEPLLRERLSTLLSRLWPGLRIAQARNGQEAVEVFERERPNAVFLDVHMPGLDGIEAAKRIGRQAHLVFVTAFDQYAVEAFRRGAIDYVLKPIEEERLADTVQRLKERLGSPLERSQHDWEAALDRIAAQMRERATPRTWLKWIKASVGTTVRLIPVDQVIYVKSDNKYTMVVWDGGEALIRKTIRELAEELDPQRFAQVHRSAIVCLDRVSHFTHGPGDAGEVHLKGRDDRVAVSRSYLHLFQQM